MKTFLKTLYFIFLVIIIIILIPSIVSDCITNSYITNNSLELFIGKIAITITCLFFICLIISNIFKDINNKYNKLYKLTMDIYNHHVNTHNKILDGLSVVKQTSINILNLDKIIKATERQGKVNQDSLSQQRDLLRDIVNLGQSSENIHKKFLDIYKDSNINLITVGNEFKNTNINLEIIKDNQKYLVDQLIISKPKRVYKPKVKSKD